MAVLASSAFNLTSAAINTTGATVLILHISYQNSIGLVPFSDSASNIWIDLGPNPSCTFGGQVGLYAAIAPITSATHTVTLSPGPGQLPCGIFAAFNEPVLSTITAAQDQAQGDVLASPTSFGSITPPQNGTMILAGAVGYSNASITVAAPFAIVAQFPGNPGVNYDAVLAYAFQATAGAITPAFTFASGDEGAYVASLEPSGGGGGTTWPGYQSPFGWS